MRNRHKSILLLGIMHLPLGIVLYWVGGLAILHPTLVFMIGLYWALQREQPLSKVSLAVGYLVGAEVLWRMAQVPIFWEFGKYGSIVIMAVALIRRGKFEVPQMPIVYFVALLPSCFLAATQLEADTLRGQLSFNMSGPLSLVVFCWFFSNMALQPTQVKNLLWAIATPLLSVACATLFYTVTVEEIQFTTESNFATSGGFGPNQVSTMLGLGLFISLGCLVLFKNDTKLKIVFFLAALFFAAQSMMTFSRSGVYNGIGAFLVLLLFSFRSITSGLRRMIPVLVLVGLFFLVLFPAMNRFTDGKLQERFEETDPTNRTEILWSDLQMFAENPVLGVGVGVSRNYRERYVEQGAASHTEFSRLLSEHGIFGFVALAALATMTVSRLLSQKTILGRAFVASAPVWSSLYMLNSGMRLAAPALLWGLVYMSFNYSQRKRIEKGGLLLQTKVGTMPRQVLAGKTHPVT